MFPRTAWIRITCKNPLEGSVINIPCELPVRPSGSVWIWNDRICQYWVLYSAKVNNCYDVRFTIVPSSKTQLYYQGGPGCQYKPKHLLCIQWTFQDMSQAVKLCEIHCQCFPGLFFHKINSVLFCSFLFFILCHINRGQRCRKTTTGSRSFWGLANTTALISRLIGFSSQIFLMV